MDSGWLDTVFLAGGTDKNAEDVEDWWVDADFIEDEFSLAERLKAVVQATAY